MAKAHRKKTALTDAIHIDMSVDTNSNQDADPLPEIAQQAINTESTETAIIESETAVNQDDAVSVHSNHDQPTNDPEPTNDDDDGPSSFEDISKETGGLDARLLRAIAKMGFSRPTLVQAKAIPLALAGKDILARARTGSGKTAAYCIPVVQKILAAKNNPSASAAVRALVLVPTRELAEQTFRHIRQLAMYAPKEVRVVNIATNETQLSNQRAVLAELPDIVVATPTKALAHVDSGNLILRDSLESLVIDEADLIFSHGYNDDLRKLLAQLPRIYQSYLMSATLSENVDEIKQLVLRNPAILELKESREERNMLTQYYIECTDQDKFLLTFFILKLRVNPFGSGKSIIFVNSIDRCYRLKLFLEQFGIRSCALNSELPLKSRFHVVQEFNKGVYDVIIATDESGELKGREADSDDEHADTSAENGSKKRKGGRRQRDTEYGVARGIDFVNVQSVINFDLPRSSRAYQHRVGRTARGIGTKGYALSFVLKDDESQAVDPSALKSKQKSGTVTDELRIQRHSDARILSRIQRRQSAQNRDLIRFSFDMTQVDGFRYRCTDAMRAVTTTSIRSARLKELKTEILNSEKLKTHFDENPRDLEALRHDVVVHPTRVQSHLRHVPSYLVPRGRITVCEGESTASVHFRTGNKKRGVSKKSGKTVTSAAAKRRADPLKSFRAASTTKSS